MRITLYPNVISKYMQISAEYTTSCVFLSRAPPSTSIRVQYTANLEMPWGRYEEGELGRQAAYERQTGKKPYWI